MGKLLVSGSMQSTNKLFVGSSSNEETSPGVGIHVWDIRDGTITPNSFGEQSINFYFDQEVDGDWKSIMHIKGWTGDYAAWQIAAQASNSATESNSLYFRTGIKSSWNSWHTLLDNKNYTSYTVTKTGSGASGTWGINITGNAATASYLNPMNSTTTNASTWDGAAESGGQITWRQAFKYSSFSEDTGDIVFKLRKNNGTELCICIDGDYYSMGNKVLHAGNYTSYTVTKTGSGASGTWGINISGQADSVYGRYTSNGGNQVPSYIGANTTKFNMMRNFGSSDIGGYMDCILMNNYSWSDVPYATGLGITKVNGYPRAIIANGPKDKWAYTTELLTSYNYSWWALPVSGGTMTGLLTFNLNNMNVTIGQQNGGHFHFIVNSGSQFSSFYFNSNVMVDGALGIYNMNSRGCGSSFPSNPSKGQIFFKI